MFDRVRSRAGASLALASVVLMVPGIAAAQRIDENLWVTNGTVLAVSHHRGTVYIGGSFTRVGPPTGRGVPISASTGAALAFPKVSGGSVDAVASDGAGGWYLGGSFTHVSGVPRKCLAHVLGDHTLSSWDPGAGSSIGSILALVVSGTTVYVGGTIFNIQGQSRSGLAAIDATTGGVMPWTPGGSNPVSALAVDGTTLYVAGGFFGMGGQLRRGLAAVDAMTGELKPWDPNPNVAAVNTLRVDDGIVYVGGGFTSIGVASRNRIAAISATTGLATDWDPDADGVVRDIVVVGGNVYACGEFTNIGGAPRSYVAELDATNGSATTWNPAPDGFVRSLAAGVDVIYAGGDFEVIGGEPRFHLAALDALGQATGWDPDAGSTVMRVAVSGDMVFAGGWFTTIGGVARDNLAALNLASGMATGWNPGADYTVLALDTKGNTVYVGGNFTTIDGQPRNSIAAIDATTGSATAWDPNAGAGGVQTLKVEGNTVYVGGNFTTIGGQARSSIAELDATTGLATAWDPNVTGLSLFVYALFVDGSTIYAGGTFTGIGGQARNRIAALDAATGLATAWDPNANQRVEEITVHEGVVYAGGAFTNIGGQARTYFAALDPSTGLATAWNPLANNIPFAILGAGSSVYAGGHFSSIGGEQRLTLAAVDATSGLATPWNPEAGAMYAYALDTDGVSLLAGGDFSVVAGHPQQGIARIWLRPEISHVSTGQGGGAGRTTVTVVGAHFQDGATAALSRTGEADLEAAQVEVAADGRSLTGTFDLRGAALGAWDVTLTNPDLQSVTLTGGLSVDADTRYALGVQVLGPRQMRPNRRTAFDVVLENRGNTDAPGTPLWITGIPIGSTVEPDFPVSAPPQDGGEPDWSAAPLTFDGPGGTYLVVVIPRLAPGITVRRFHLTVPNSVSAFELGAALAPPWSDRGSFASCLSDAGVVTASACMGAQLSAIESHLDATTGIRALSGIGVWAKIAWQCEGAGTLPAALVEAEEALDFMLQPVEGSGTPGGCEVDLTPRWQVRWPVTVVTSVDPNEKVGPAGTGPGHRIGGTQVVPYSIRFENLEAASAPAQQVTVVDALDTATLDEGTVSLGPITFGERTLYPPPGLSSYATEVDLRPEVQLFVAIGVSLDPATGVLTLRMDSIDPATDDLPLDPNAGFLPPNLAPPEGEGSLLFTVMPLPELTENTPIANDATILFDGVPLDTDPWTNVVDATAPQSAVLPLPATQDSATFTVHWDTEGSAPDLHDYSIFVSENGAAYRPWRVHVTATADTFAGPGGGTYAFYSIARDSSGNTEDAPGSPDAETTVIVGVGDVAPLALAIGGPLANPAIGDVRVRFTLARSAPATLEVVDVMGRRVLWRDVTAFGPGRHVVDLGRAVQRPGLYFLRLVQGSNTALTRMVVLR